MQSDSSAIVSADEVSLTGGSNDRAVGVVDLDAFLGESQIDGSGGVCADVVVENLRIVGSVDADTVDGRAGDDIAMPGGPSFAIKASIDVVVPLARSFVVVTTTPRKASTTALNSDVLFDTSVTVEETASSAATPAASVVSIVAFPETSVLIVSEPR